jgi:uncharacterized protein (DUF302 family)
MTQVEYTVEARKSFDEAVQAVETETAAKGFSVLHTHDLAATLAAKGFRHEPLKIIEICNARYANEALAKDIRLAVMLPCRITVYSEQGKTFISTFRPSVIPSFFPEAGAEAMAGEVEKLVLDIVNKAKEKAK